MAATAVEPLDPSPHESIGEWRPVSCLSLSIASFLTLQVIVQVVLPSTTFTAFELII